MDEAASRGIEIRCVIVTGRQVWENEAIKKRLIVTAVVNLSTFRHGQRGHLFDKGVHEFYGRSKSSSPEKNIYVRDIALNQVWNVHWISLAIVVEALS
jgi:hypothetical protein